MAGTYSYIKDDSALYKKKIDNRTSVGALMR